MSHAIECPTATFHPACCDHLAKGLMLKADTGLAAPLEGGLYDGELDELHGERAGEGDEYAHREE